jgi:DNA-binding NtrC family response regulator
MSRILVVDDQAEVRAMIAIVLRVHRFEIVEAENPAAALKAIEEASFDLAIVDIFLHNSNGFDLIATMREQIPNLPVVAISGVAALDLISDSPDLTDIVCLQKPFRPNQLMQAMEEARALFRPAAPAAKCCGGG